jgi:hypothetical protein
LTSGCSKFHRWQARRIAPSTIGAA